MTVREYAKLIGKSPRRVRDLIATGEVIATKGEEGWDVEGTAEEVLNGQWRRAKGVPLTDIEAAMKKIRKNAPLNPPTFIGGNPISVAFDEAMAAIRSGSPLPPKRTHLIIPDCQVHAGVPTEHLTWIGRYIAHKRPDVIICIGDFADMPSLSFYAKGKKSFEGRRFNLDVEAAHDAMELLVKEFRDIPGYKPRMVLTLGNHEARITRFVEEFAVLDGTISLHSLAYESFGWEVFPYLQVVEIDGVEYAHYFKGLGAKGFPVSSAKALLNARGGSAVMGHTQHTDVAFHAKTQQIGIFCGTCYLHDEEYLGEQGNVQRRQIVVLHEVEDGRCDPMFVSLDFLRRRYSAPERKAA